MTKRDCILEHLSKGLSVEDVASVCGSTPGYVRIVRSNNSYGYVQRYNRNLLEFGRIAYKSMRGDLDPYHYVESFMAGAFDSLPLVYENGRVYANPELYFRGVLSS